jgi:hypothetical protein
VTPTTPVPPATSARRLLDPSDGLTTELVAQLTGEQQDLPTAALGQIGLPIDRWRDLKVSTRGTLLGLWRPKELT